VQGSGAELQVAAGVNAFAEATNHTKWLLFLMRVKLLVCYSQQNVEISCTALFEEVEDSVAVSQLPLQVWQDLQGQAEEKVVEKPPKGSVCSRKGPAGG